MSPNGIAIALENPAHPLSVQLLSEEEARSIEGGAILMPALYLIAATGAAGLAGVALGVAVYYFTR